ncbi:MAG: hypothetical protein J6N45_09765 [Alphaproteobacteria bacterium]|nr:hypothetical protein [Alphaproteobacteria bacterium]
MYENWKILKSELNEHLDEYSAVAEWCNSTGEYTIIDDGEYYRVVHIEPEPEPQPEESEAENVSN